MRNGKGKAQKSFQTRLSRQSIRDEKDPHDEHQLSREHRRYIIPLACRQSLSQSLIPRGD